MTPTFGSLFAGVGGFDLGFETAGFECRFQVEWDQHCQQTLAHHWPNVPRWADVSDVNGAHLPPVDVITYGFPCQDLSVAGKRAGLDGNRSHLFFEAVRIITEMRQATNGRYPTWAVAENVAGLLNADNGTAMGRVIDELAAAGAVVIEWATLDAQWFGVPQRRRRVFIAACFNPATGDRCPDPLFPVAPGSSRNPATSDTTREKIAGTIGTSAGGRGARGNCEAHVAELADALLARDYKGINSDGLDTKLIAYNKSQFAGYSEGVGSLCATQRQEDVLIVPRRSNIDVLDTRVVRRLSPIECERLMGWPDDHTLHRADGKTNPDSTRYKMCGNGVAAPVAAWIAKHLRNTLT